jgi:preprotein translocase subunit SecD
VLDLKTRLTPTDFQVALDHDQMGRAEVAFRFGPADAQRLRALTTANVGQRLALVAGGRVLSAPVLSGPISDKARVTLGTTDGPAAVDREAAWLVEQIRQVR